MEFMTLAAALLIGIGTAAFLISALCFGRESLPSRTVSTLSEFSGRGRSSSFSGIVK
jgi:hypothetical protein